jgi:hypothetical protein
MTEERLHNSEGGGMPPDEILDQPLQRQAHCFIKIDIGSCSRAATRSRNTLRFSAINWRRPIAYRVNRELSGDNRTSLFKSLAVVSSNLSANG